jgi:predicted NodU family carbamoyl transferase
MLHASCAFINSGFSKASILIIDGAGSKENNGIVSLNVNLYGKVIEKV